MSQYVTADEYQSALEIIKRAIENRQLFVDHERKCFVTDVLYSAPHISSPVRLIEHYPVGHAALIGREYLERERMKVIINEMDQKKIIIKVHMNELELLSEELKTLEPK